MWHMLSLITLEINHLLLLLPSHYFQMWHMLSLITLESTICFLLPYGYCYCQAPGGTATTGDDTIIGTSGTDTISVNLVMTISMDVQVMIP